MGYRVADLDESIPRGSAQPLPRYASDQLLRLDPAIALRELLQLD